MVIEILVVVIAVLSVVVILLVRKINSIDHSLQEHTFDKQSLRVKFGKMTEQFFPFLKKYSYNPQNFRFIGSPIDGIQFEKDKVIFVEFKTGNSSLSKKQKEIKDIIGKKKVTFEEVRIKD